MFTTTGYNRENLWLHCHDLAVLDAPRSDRPHWPSYVWLTEALDTSARNGEAEALLEHADRDEGMSLFAVDGKTNESVILNVARRYTPEFDDVVGLQDAEC